MTTKGALLKFKSGRLCIPKDIFVERGDAIWKEGNVKSFLCWAFRGYSRVGRLAYQVTLPSDQVGMHNIFHISMLRKYIPNSNLVVEYKLLKIQEVLTYTEELVRILEWNEQVLHSKRIFIIRHYGAITESRKHPAH